MLVLTRRVGEAIVIGSDVVVTVLYVRGNRARLGVTAGGDTSVHRAEVDEKIRAELQNGSAITTKESSRAHPQ